MFDNPEITRQLVNGRLDQRRHEAAERRLGGSGRRRTTRLRMPRTAWFGRRRRPLPAPKPSPA